MIFTQLKAQVTIFSVIACLLIVSEQANSSTLHDVNVVAIAVEDQTESARRSALNAAFRQVVLKMSGDRTKFNPRQLRNYAANDYLKAYQYEMSGSQLEYVATFDTAKLQQLLRMLALPIWEARRPDTMLWLASDLNASSNLTVLSESSDSVFYDLIDTLSRQRGVDIVLPLMDIEDSSAVSAYDVWGRFMTPLLSASERYSIDHVIATRIRKTPEYDVHQLEQRIETMKDEHQPPQASPLLDNPQLMANRVLLEYPSIETFTSINNDNALFSTIESAQPKPAPIFSVEEFGKLVDGLQPYQLDYTFHIKGIFESGVLAGESPEQLLSEMLASYSDKLSQGYAVQLGQSTDSNVIVLQVNNITSLQKYAQVTAFLSTLTLIDSVILVEQKGATAQFKVSLLADKERLIDTLLLDGRLMPLVNDFGDVIDDSQFYWN